MLKKIFLFVYVLSLVLSCRGVANLLNNPEDTILTAFQCVDRKEAYQYFAIKKYIWEFTKRDYLGIFRNPLMIYRIYMPKKQVAYFFARFNYDVMQMRKSTGQPKIVAVGLDGRRALVEVKIDSGSGVPLLCRFEMYKENDGWKIFKFDGVPNL